jgi:uncharacterized protein (UPF0332 family)
MENEIIELAKYRLEKARSDYFSAKMLFENKMYSQSLNRSYYAIFHSTRALLSLEKFDSKKHSGIIAYFNKNYIANGIFEKEMSKIIMGAEKIRIQSDYDDFYLVSKEDTLNQLNNAEIFIQKIEEYISMKTAGKM